ncbi:MAG TPA: Rid family hydrolase [Gemmatimonadaceae bacterium]|nr:Rid family hydrolase [Gemmatimonadaceae bacterium]
MSERAWAPIFLPADVPLPAGAYSPAVRAGDFIHVSGQVPKDPRTGQVVGTAIEEQTAQVIANVRELLAAAGATLDDVVAATIYLTDEQDWPIVNEIWKSTFSAPYPSRTTVGARLRGILIEITVVAYRPR